VSKKSVFQRLAYSALLLCLCATPLPGAAAGGDEADQRPHVLLLTIDTLRADHLGCYGYRLETSPTIDALADRGVRFSDCMVQWPKTWPSLASLLSGAYPRTTGIRYARKTLPAAMHMLAEVFSEGGYATAAVVSNCTVGKHFNFHQGFDVFVESWQERWQAQHGKRIFRNEGGLVKRYTDAGLVVDQALRWLDERTDDRPVFMWLHFMDPHGPYVPPAGYENHFVEDHPTEMVPLEVIPEYQRQPDPIGDPITDLGFYKTQYDREIRYQDDELQRLLGELRARGLMDNALLALTADHGESLGEHDYYLEHGRFSYQVNAHVPLILVWEGRLPARRIIDRPVGLIDLAPTLVALAGLPPVGSHEGLDLRSLIDGGMVALAPDCVFMESGYYTPDSQRTVRRGRWKLIHVRSPLDRDAMDGGEWELYDLENDAYETRNLATAHPQLVSVLAGILEDWAAVDGPEIEPLDVDMDELSDRDKKILRSLGY